jgi:di- and tripeptidase
MNTYWAGEEVPCLVYGLRGVVSLELEVTGPKSDLHSGVDGGSVHEPYAEMVQLLSSLVDAHSGRVNVPTFYDSVRGVSPAELQLFESVDFDVNQFAASIGRPPRTTSRGEFLAARWAEPSLSIVAVQSSSTSPSVISNRVTAGISIRTVPDQHTPSLIDAVKTYLHQKFAALNTPNTLAFRILHTGQWWIGDRSNPFYEAAEKAILEEWKVKPNYIREGGSIPITAFLEKALKAPAIHFPVGQATDRAHLNNERIRLENLIKCKEVLKRFFLNIAALKPNK